MTDVFEPRFADLVRIFTTTRGIDDFIIGAAVTGFRSFNATLEIGDRFYYCAIHLDRPSEREIGRGTLRADGKIAREPINGSLVDFSPGTKTVSLVAAAEWYNGIKAAVAGTYTADATGAVGRSYVSKFGERLSVLDFVQPFMREDIVGRTGRYDHSSAILAAIQAAVDTRTALYFPAGQYNFGAAGSVADGIVPMLGEGASVHLFGDGPKLTVIREAAGQNAIAGRYDEILSITAPPDVSVEHLIIRDMTFDKNGSSNASPAQPYDWEQSHCLRIAAASGARIRHVLIDNVEIVDKVGGGIVFAGGAIDTAIVRNCHARDFSGKFGERGDIEFQSTIAQLTIEDCGGSYIQTEPNAAAPEGGIAFARATMSRCSFATFDLMGFSGAVTAANWRLEDCRADRLLCADGQLNIRGGRYGLRAADYWRRAAPGSGASDALFVTAYDGATNSTSGLYPKAETTLGGFHFTFIRCRFEPGAGANSSTTGTAISSSANGYNGAQPFLVRLVECTFSPLYERTLDAYRSGNYELIRCKIGGWATTGNVGAIRCGSDAVNISNVIIEDCDFSAATASNRVYCQNGGAGWTLKWRGVHDYADCRIGTSSPSNIQPCVRFEGLFVAASKPAGYGVTGQRVRVNGAAFGDGLDYVATSTNGNAATFALAAQNGIKKDVSANRPAASVADAGLRFIDTGLADAGKPITWTGTAWVDSAGAPA